MGPTYRAAVRCVWHNPLVFVVVAVAASAVQVYSSNPGVTNIIPTALLALFMHRSILLGAHAWEAISPRVMLVFLGLCLGYGLLHVAAVVGLVAYLSPSLTGLPEAARAGVAAILAFPAVLLLNALLLPFFGTMFPAAALGKPIWFATALRQSRGQRLVILWRLISGPFAFGVVAFVLVLELGSVLEPLLPQGWAHVLFATALNTFVVILGVAVLSLAYSRAREGQSG